jgi:hypothetical protein
LQDLRMCMSVLEKDPNLFKFVRYNLQQKCKLMLTMPYVVIYDIS